MERAQVSEGNWKCYLRVLVTEGVKMTAYHPFRSVEAKERYLLLYDSIAKKWPIDSESRMVDTFYGQTFVRISGQVDAPPLVLLPGVNENSLQWMPNIEDLSNDYRTFAIDFHLIVDDWIGSGCLLFHPSVPKQPPRHHHQR